VLFFGGGALSVFGLVLVPMTDELNWSRSSLSLVLTTFMIVSALAMPFVGRIVDRTDLRLILTTAVVLVGIGAGLMWRVNALWQVFLLYGIVFAIGNAGSSVPTVTVMVSRWWTTRRGMANSAAIAGMGLGQLVIIITITFLLSTIGWRTSYAIIGAANLFIVVPVVLMFARSGPRGASALGPSEGGSSTVDQGIGEPLGEPNKETPLVAVNSVRDLFRSRHMWLLMSMFALCGFQDFFVLTHVVAFATDLGVSDLLAGNMLAFMGLTALIGVMLSGYLSDRYGPAVPSVLCFVIRTGIFVFILNSQATPSIMVFALLYGSTFFITAPLGVIFAGQIFGSRYLGTVSGIVSMVHQVFGGLGALAGGLFFDAFGRYDGAFALVLGLALLAVVVSALLHRSRRNAPRPA
jgi:sugar phosphate permease